METAASNAAIAATTARKTSPARTLAARLLAGDRGDLEAGAVLYNDTAVSIGWRVQLLTRSVRPPVPSA
jgi:hypothetical protein